MEARDNFNESQNLKTASKSRKKSTNISKASKMQSNSAATNAILKELENKIKSKKDEIAFEQAEIEASLKPTAQSLMMSQNMNYRPMTAAPKSPP